VRLNGDGIIRPVVVGKRNPPRVQIRVGPLRMTFTVPEAVDLANRLIDVVERIDSRKRNPRNNAT